jgi:hypothetical protein
VPNGPLDTSSGGPFAFWVQLASKDYPRGMTIRSILPEEETALDAYRAGDRFVVRPLVRGWDRRLDLVVRELTPGEWGVVCGARLIRGEDGGWMEPDPFLDLCAAIDAETGKGKGRASQGESARARTRFLAAEARGQDPWNATAKRINAMGNKRKIAGTAMFLHELLAERPHERSNIRQLLDLLGPVDVPSSPKRRKKPKPTGDPFLDLCAAIDAEAARRPASTRGTPVPRFPVSARDYE